MQNNNWGFKVKSDTYNAHSYRYLQIYYVSCKYFHCILHLHGFWENYAQSSVWKTKFKLVALYRGIKLSNKIITSVIAIIIVLNKTFEEFSKMLSYLTHAYGLRENVKISTLELHIVIVRKYIDFLILRFS